MRVASPWSLVLPVKGGPWAKTRLGAGPHLALALALDTLVAVVGCARVGRVVVVTSDPWVARSVRRAGRPRRPVVDVVSESRPGAGLVAAVLDGIEVAGGRAGPVAVLLADVPSARCEDLTVALDAAAGVLATGAQMAVVADAEARGTVLLAAARGADLDPAFGPHSLAEHRRRGAGVVEADLPRLRRDVDTPAELASALALGVGRYTRRALAEESEAVQVDPAWDGEGTAGAQAAWTATHGFSTGPF